MRNIFGGRREDLSMFMYCLGDIVAEYERGECPLWEAKEDIMTQCGRYFTTLGEAVKAYEDITEEIEREANRIFFPELSREVNVKIRNFLLDGQKIPAIKAYRNHVACGLREAKEKIDSVLERL